MTSYQDRYLEFMHSFMTDLSRQFNLDKKELERWFKQPMGTGLSNVDMSDTSPDRLLECSPKERKALLKQSLSSENSDLSKLTLEELKAKCKAQGVKVSGKKADLIDRLSGKEETKSNKSSKEEKEEKKSKAVEGTKSKEPKSRSKSELKPLINPVVAKLTAEEPPSKPMLKNKFGNHEHKETGLVFNPTTKSVIGTQNENGSINQLTVKDIELCKKFKFPFTVPENLNTNKSNVKVSELGSDSESDVEEVKPDSDDDLVVADSDEDEDEDEEDEDEDEDE